MDGFDQKNIKTIGFLRLHKAAMYTKKQASKLLNNNDLQDSLRNEKSTYLPEKQ